MSLTNNRANVRSNLKIDPNKKIWSDADLTRYINEGQKWILNDPAVNWEFGETIGYLVPVLDYQEYRASTDDLPENFFNPKIRTFLKARASNGTNINFSDWASYNNNVTTAPSVISQYANRFFLNAGFQTAPTYTTLHNMDTYDGDGTWAGTNDATTVATDASTYKEGSGSVSFAIDVSNSTSNKATLTNSTMTSVDISGNELNNGGIMLWAYFTSGTDIKAIEVKFGSDSSNYYAVKNYQTVQGSKYADGWNRIFIPTINRQTTGTPDLSAVDYLQVNIVFDSGEEDQATCRIDNIQYVDKYIEYWFTQQSTDLSADSDESVIPSQYQYVYETYAEYKALRIVPGMEQRATMRLDEAKLYKNQMIEELMYNLPRSFEMLPR